VTVVEFTTLRLLTVTPVPDTTIDVVPARFVPVRVTPTLVPRWPMLGAIEVSVGATTVNAAARAAFPLGVWTVTVLAVVPAVIATVKVAVTVVAFTLVKLLTVTPVPDTVTPVADPKPVPVMVTGTAVPRRPVLGETPVTVGAATVKVTALLVPPAETTVTFLAVSPAVPEIVNVAVTVVGLTTLTALTVTPVPDTFTAVTPDRFVPVRVTGTLVFRPPELGAIVLSTGADTPAPWNSTAPTSNPVGEDGSGRGFPKKSVLTCGCATGM
jgi:hypothetical protein